MQDVGTIRRLAAGEHLFRADEDGDSVFVVRDGVLEVVQTSGDHEIVVARLGPGEIVGEITAVIGGRRTATVRACLTGPAAATELTADEFTTWLAEWPDEAHRIAEQARDRIDRLRVTRVLGELIGPGHGDVVDDVTELLEWTRIEAGTTLFSQGDHADAAYIVVTGRLRLVSVLDGETTLDVSVGRGDIVGELGIIEQAPRSASAIATRDTTLAKLSDTSFETLTGKHPKLMLQVFRKILTRVIRPTHRSPHAGMIAVAVLSPGADAGIVRAIAAEIERHGTTLYLDREQVGRFFDRRGVVDATAGSAEHARLAEFLSEADVAHRWVVLETDRTSTTWTAQALRSADRVVLVTSPFPDERELALVRRFTETVDQVPDRDLWVVQANHSSIMRPVANREVMLASRPDRILQHRRNDPGSTGRIARLVSGTATGVALSGGGGRAFAQIGALRALVDSGFTIDVITGTSMGSIVAGMHAFVDDAHVLAERVEDGFRGADILDYTLPLVSLVSGKGLTEAIEYNCGPILIEELAVPFSCLSTNLTTAQLVEHRRGSLAAALRSSVSLPGVFPPVVVDGELLVDGGILENLPVSPLVRDPSVSTVVAVDVALPAGPSSRVAYGTGVSGHEVVRSRLSRRNGRYPGITTTVMASMLLGSARSRREALADGRIDVYLSLNLRGVKLLDFAAIAEIADRGYDAAVAELESGRAHVRT